MKNLYLVMPAYNEEENIESTVKDWYPVLSGKGANSRLVIADSGSKDRTHEILQGLKQEYPKLEILSDSGTFHGPKLIALYKYAIKNGADYIFQTDSDGQTNPKEFDDFYKEIENHDAVIGFRPVRGDGKARAFVEKVVCLLLRMYYHVNVPDANAPFRLMKADLVAKYVDRFQDDYNLPNIMLTTFFAYYKENLLFKEISFKPHQGGTNSINIPKIVKIGFHALSDFRNFKRGM